MGCYDGSVRVYDIRRKEDKHIFMSNVKSGSHQDPVWATRWAAADTASDLSFYSISSDGRVCSWALSKQELTMEVVMMLKLVSSGGAADTDEASLTGLAGGCCFDFNRTTEHLYVGGKGAHASHLFVLLRLTRCWCD